MKSLQELCYQVVCLNPEQTLGLDIDGISQPCLVEIVQLLSLYDLLQYEKLLTDRGINAGEALHKRQMEIWGGCFCNPMLSTVCPHRRDISSCDDHSWCLSKVLHGKVIRPLVEDHHLIEQNSSFVDYDRYFLHLFSEEMQLHIFCPPGSKARDLKARLHNIPKGFIINLIVSIAQKTLLVTSDIKFCQFFSFPSLQNCMASFHENLQTLSIILNSSYELVSFVRVLREQSKRLHKICVHAIKSSDLQTLDCVLSVCSGVTSFHNTAQGKLSKASLDAMLAADLSRQPPSSDVLSEKETVDSVTGEQPTMTLDEKGDKHEDSEDFDLMDDAVLFGTSASIFDSITGIEVADLKFTNLVSRGIYPAIVNHHLQHWLALRELHLGVPEMSPLVIQGLTCLLKRPQFLSLTLSCALVSSAEMREILIAVATNRDGCPLERLMFVSLQTKNKANNMPITLDVEDLNPITLSDYGGLEDEFGKVSDNLTQYGEFDGTKVLEVSCCVLDVFTGIMLKQFARQSTALCTLCVTNSFHERFITHFIDSLAQIDYNKSLSSLILEDWWVEDNSTCRALTKILTRCSKTLTTLSLRQCFVSRHLSEDMEDVIEAISCCSNLSSLDLGKNRLDQLTPQFVGKVMKCTRLKELSLKNNLLRISVVLSTLRQIHSATKDRGSCLHILNIQGNQIRENDGKDNDDLLWFLKNPHNKVAERLLYDDDSKHHNSWQEFYQ